MKQENKQKFQEKINKFNTNNKNTKLIVGKNLL